MSTDHRHSVLVVDDTPVNLKVATDVLRSQYQALAANSGEKALALLDRRPDVALVLLDVMMPEMDGFEVCRQIKDNPKTAHIPVMFLTALSSPEDEQNAFEAGGVDFITKPFQPDTMMARIGAQLRIVEHEQELEALVRERTEELDRRTTELLSTRFQIISQLGRAAEFPDDPTGTHVIRMAHYARLLAEAIGLSDEQVQLIYEASPMHDIGKAGIPDEILRKPGPLTDEEFETFKHHTVIGAEIIGHPASDLLACARVISLTHHEQWDGSGYPAGLAGEDIPLEGRITAIADVFDALTSVRPHRAAWSIDEAVEAMRDAAGTHFDPALLDAFFDRLTDVQAIQQRFGRDVDASLAAAESAGFAGLTAFRVP